MQFTRKTYIQKGWSCDQKYCAIAEDGRKYLLRITPVGKDAMVNGYFEGTVPVTFWRLLALYISSNTLSFIPWAVPFGESEIRTMLNQAGDVLAWYDNMEKVVPEWYKGTLDL